MGKPFPRRSPAMASAGSSHWRLSAAIRLEDGMQQRVSYLQVEERVPAYAYLPSHYGLSNLSFEALGELRMTLLPKIKEEGPESLKRMSRYLKRERRDRPKKVLKLKKSIYGIPDAGRAFSMFVPGLHTKRCSLTQSEMNPRIFYKINTDVTTKDDGLPGKAVREDDQ
jgi:hypothetical protein